MPPARRRRSLAPVLFLLLVGSAGGAVYYVWETDPARLPLPLYDTMNAIQAAVPEVSRKVVEQVSHLAKPQSADDAPGAGRPPPQTVVSANQVTLYLRNGGVVTGELVERTREAVTLRWDYGDVTFQAAEIARLVEGRELEGDAATQPVIGDSH